MTKLITDAELDESAKAYEASAKAVADVIEVLDPAGVVRALLDGSSFAERMSSDPGFVVLKPGEEPQTLQALLARARART